VTLALRAMLAVIALTAIESVLEFTDWEWTNLLFDALFVALSSGFVLGYLALTYFVSKRRRWARTTTVVVSVMSLVLLPIVLWEFPPTDGYDWAWNVGYAVLDITILCSILSRSAREWFSPSNQVQDAL
jgi:hypothetical protein